MVAGPPDPVRRPLGRSGIPIAPLALGTSGLGGMPDLYGYDVAEADAISTIRAVLNSPIRFLDTANGYADAERRIGAAITASGGLPDDFVIATKLDPADGDTDLSGRRVRASLEESFQRLGVPRIPLLYLHDPERIGTAAALRPGGPVEMLATLRDEKVVDHIGVAGGAIGVMTDLVGTGVCCDGRPWKSSDSRSSPGSRRPTTGNDASAVWGS